MTFTKEQLIARAETVLSNARTAADFHDSKPYHLMDIHLAEIALAALTASEQEPVYQACKEAGVWVDIDAQDVDSLRFNGEQIRKVYTAPPAPLSVPEPIKRNDADGWWMYKGRRVGGGCAEWYNRALDDCRAAMLQGAEPVSQPYTLPSREHFESLCCKFWNWRELDSINEGEEEPRLWWDGNDYTHRVTKALWRMYQAASQPHNEVVNKNWPPR